MRNCAPLLAFEPPAEEEENEEEEEEEDADEANDDAAAAAAIDIDSAEAADSAPNPSSA